MRPPSSTVPPRHALWEANRGCSACELRGMCSGPVPAEGHTSFPYSGLMVVGEAPGRSEDERGRPFVGKAGMELEGYLWAAGLRRSDVFISNTTKCRPSGKDAKEDWKPSPNQVEVCTGLWLEKEIELVRPRVILSLGEVSTRYFLGNTFTSMGELSSAPQKPPGRDFWVVPSFHPAAALRKRDGAGPLMRGIQKAFQIAVEVLAGRWNPPVDLYPNPKYLSTDRDGQAGLDLFYKTLEVGQQSGRMALDTEFLEGGRLFCISLSAIPGTGVVIFVKEEHLINSLRLFIVNPKSPTIIMHNAQADLPVLWRVGIYPRKIADSQYLLYWEGEVIQGLKPTARRLLGMEMDDYSDITRLAQQKVAREYLEGVGKQEWPDPEPFQEIVIAPPRHRRPRKGEALPEGVKRVLVDGGGYPVVRTHTPQSIGKKAKKILADFLKGGENSTVDLAGRWEGIPEGEREVVERELGRMPTVGIDKVEDLRRVILYSCRDADSTLRLAMKLGWKGD